MVVMLELKLQIITPDIELDVNGDIKFAHGLVVGVTTGLCAVDFSNCVDIFDGQCIKRYHLHI